MSDLSLFMKSNKKMRKNTKYAATKSLCDKNGKPLEWEIRPLTTDQNNMITDECTREVSIPGKPNMFRTKLNATKYATLLICRSVVYPNLNDKSLQDSYGVKSAEQLITKMIDDPGEFNRFGEFLQSFNGFDDINEDVEKAKN